MTKSKLSYFLGMIYSVHARKPHPLVGGVVHHKGE